MLERSAKLEGSLVSWETGRQGATQAILSRRLTSDQDHRKVSLDAAPAPAARRGPDPSSHDGRVRPGAAARGDHPGRIARRDAVAARRAGAVARHEHLSDPRGGPPA